MRAAFSTLSPFAPDVTSVMHGGHVANSAHYAGRAVDVGAFGNTPVGVNGPTFAALFDAISSGKFEAIGTLPEIVSNPLMQTWAKQYGVRLFPDVGSGPHVHFQVAQ